MPQESKYKIEINREFKRALDLLQNTDKSAFITGKAGTGKSTLLDYFRTNTKKQVVVLAPTGVAALNIGGQTIHSFFRFGTDVTCDKIKKKLPPKTSAVIRKLDVLVIDEISMVRADLLDCIDRALRLNTGSEQPFGGKQVAFFGDLHQLPPVVKSAEKEAFTHKYETCYFYSADVMRDFKMEFIELDTIYRQHDNVCIDILNGIRNNTITDELIDVLNSRFDPDFVPDRDDFFVTLTPLNSTAQKMNEFFLSSLEEEQHVFQAVVDGAVGKNDMPANDALTLKVDSQIMFLNNDPNGRWVNGTMGVVTEIDPEAGIICVRTMNGQLVDVMPYKWNLNRYIYDSSRKSIDTETIGSFEQFPVRLAWALTIHKSQGKTFPRLIVDASGIFAAGQVYVALSRCIGLEGLVLRRKIEKKHIFTDLRVQKFLDEKKVALPWCSESQVKSLAETARS